MNNPDKRANSLRRMHDALEGLSVGDAFGEGFFVSPDTVDDLIAERILPEPEWRFTDDTMMALSVGAILREYGYIQQDALAASFVEHYDYTRGYGPSMRRLLNQIREGTAWAEAATSQFEGQGSHGNGAAMRAAPIGAYFAEDIDSVVEQARLSAEVTHSHREGIAGAIAAAVGTALAWRHRNVHKIRGRAFLEQVLASLPESEVREKIRHARNLPETASVRLAVSALGNGVKLSAQDTVPFALWCAAKHLDSYEEALWLAISGLGDRDTICAIVGSIVVMSAGVDCIPRKWQACREPLPEWVHGNQDG